MMISVHALRALCCAAACLALAACNGHAPQEVKADAPTAPQGLGRYKVGPPYQVNGIWYYPQEDLAYNETGIASWYGPGFHEKLTANGEVFDQNAISAAHKTLPLPTLVEVTNLDNGRSIEVRVNDRGPFVGTRIIDLSRRAAQLLGFEQEGTAKVRVRVLAAETMQAQSLAKLGGSDTPPGEVPHAAPRETIVAQALPSPVPVKNAPPASPPPPPPPVQPAPKPAAPPPGFQAASVGPPLRDTVLVVPVKPSHIFVQAGAFASAANAAKMKARLDPLGTVLVTAVRINGNDIYRVRLGPVKSVDDADQMLTRVIGLGVAEAKIVVD